MYSYVRCDKSWNKRKVRKIIFNILNSAIIWKKEKVDDNVAFPDGKKIPVILVENKIDLLEKGTTEDEDKYFEKFSENDEFCGCFRASAKTGSNVNKSMEVLINTIIRRLEGIEYKNVENNDYISRTNSFVLESGKESKKKKYDCC